MNEQPASKSIWWLNVYYTRLGLGMIGVLSTLLASNPDLAELFEMNARYSAAWPENILRLLFLGLMAVVLFRLIEKTQWGYKLNFAFLIIEVFSVSFSINIVSAFLVALIWTVPNWIYFKNRKELYAGNK